MKSLVFCFEHVNKYKINIFPVVTNMTKMEYNNSQKGQILCSIFHKVSMVSIVGTSIIRSVKSKRNNHFEWFQFSWKTVMDSTHWIVLWLLKRKNEFHQDWFHHIPLIFAITYWLPAKKLVSSKTHLPSFPKFYLLNPEYFHMKWRTLSRTLHSLWRPETTQLTHN